MERGFDPVTVEAQHLRPELASKADLLVVMGGPYGVADRNRLAWLEREHEVLVERCKSRLPTIGVCLGAQLLASAMGADVTDSDAAEIGWFEVTPVGTLLPPGTFDSPFEAFHWHADSFELPEGATRLFSSQGCREQGFVRDRSLALQFHLEVVAEGVEELELACRQELDAASGGRFVQTSDTIRNSGNYQEMHDRLYALLDWFLESRVRGHQWSE